MGYKLDKNGRFKTTAGQVGNKITGQASEARINELAAALDDRDNLISELRAENESLTARLAAVNESESQTSKKAKAAKE